MFTRKRSFLIAFIPILFTLFFQVSPAFGWIDGRRPGISSNATLSFSDFSDSFLKSIGISEIEKNDKPITSVLYKGYIVAQLGRFDLWYPRANVRDSRGTNEFKAIATTFLEMQEKWIDLVLGEEMKKTRLQNLKTLQKWIRSWKHGKLGRKKDPELDRPDLLEVLDAGQDVREASKHLADLMVSPKFLGRDGQDKKPILLILSPTRENFLGLGSFIGSLSETNKKLLWNDGLAMWTSFNRGEIHVIAMEHPSTYPGNGNITQGLDMNSKEKTGLLQHVMQNACELMLERYYQGVLPDPLISGLAINMVIDMYKENNVRAGGGSKGKTIAESSRFVAGGKSSGGVLPAKNADTRWRDSKGKDHFIVVLRLTQKAGAKEAVKSYGKSRDKRAYFALEPDGGGVTRCIRAPFLITSNESHSLPDDYWNDYLEFFRAYRICFTYWLQHKVMSTKDKTSPVQRLHRLLDLSSVPRKGLSDAYFKDKILEIYGIPFSAEEGAPESLEWQYLDWLAVKKG